MNIRGYGNMRSRFSVFHLIFGIMLVIFIWVAVYLAANSKTIPLSDTEYDKTAPFMNGWHTADGMELDEKMLRKINTFSSNKEIRIYNTLPADLSDADVLFFRAKNVFYSVYIDGELVYTPEINESVFYTNSTGTRWNSIDITSEQLGKEVEIRVRPVYANARCGVDGFRIGSLGGIILNTINEKLVSFITCVLLFFVGLLLLIADIPINIRSQKTTSFCFWDCSLSAFPYGVCQSCICRFLL